MNGGTAQTGTDEAIKAALSRAKWLRRLRGRRERPGPESSAEVQTDQHAGQRAEEPAPPLSLQAINRAWGCH